MSVASLPGQVLSEEELSAEQTQCEAASLELQHHGHNSTVAQSKGSRSWQEDSTAGGHSSGYVNSHADAMAGKFDARRHGDRLNSGEEHSVVIGGRQHCVCLSSMLGKV